MSHQELGNNGLKHGDSITDCHQACDHDVYSAIELVTSCDDGQEEISGAIEDDLLDDDNECASQVDDYIISVLSNSNADEQQVTDTNEQLVQTYVNSKDFHADSSAFILKLPYPVEGTLPSLDEDDLHERPLKRFRLETTDGYDVILAVAGDDDELAFISGDGVECEEGNSAADSQFSFEKSNEDVNQAWFTTRDDKLALQNKGHKWKQGQWTKEEVELLSVNIDSYCRKRGIGDPADVIFHMSKDDRKDFYRSVAKGIERPLFSVYRRVIRMYDEKNYQGKYSADELARLRELRLQHGTDWAAIGAALGRSASSVKDRCRLMKDTCNTGKWFADEERKLSDAVYQLSGASPGESVTSGLSWAHVAEFVGTRSEKQCRTKWLNYLNWKQKGGSEWTREDDLLLLSKLSETGAVEEGSINWQTLADQWPSVRSPQWLRGKWWSMKRHVKDYHHLSFPVLLEQVQSLNTQNVVRLPQYYMTVAATSSQRTNPIDAASEMVNGSEASYVLPVGSDGYMFSLPSLGSISTDSLTFCRRLSNNTAVSSSDSFEGCTLVNSHEEQPIRVARISSKSEDHKEMSRLMTSQCVFMHSNTKGDEVEENCLAVEESCSNQDAEQNCDSIQEEFRDFQSHFTSLEQDSIEIGGEMSIVIEEDDSGDVDPQTGLLLRSDQIESYVEVMPLDDSYTEVIAEDLEINSNGDVITLVCSTSNDGDSVACFSDTILMSDSADMLGSISSDERN